MLVTVELALDQEPQQRRALKEVNGNLLQHQNQEYHTALPTVRKLG
jgi:hypothetical protein